MNTFRVTSKADKIDAVCHGKDIADALDELLHLNGYNQVLDTPDWVIEHLESGFTLKMGEDSI